MFDEITIQRLKYYVYALVNPKDNMPFYIGKEEVGSSNLLAGSNFLPYSYKYKL